MGRNKKNKEVAIPQQPVAEEPVIPQQNPVVGEVDNTANLNTGANDDDQSHSETSSSEGEGGIRADSDDEYLSDMPIEDQIDLGVKAGISAFLENELSDLLEKKLSAYLTSNGFSTERDTSPAVPQSLPMAARSPKARNVSSPTGEEKMKAVKPILKEKFPVAFSKPLVTLIPEIPKSVTTVTTSTIGNSPHSLYSIMCITFSSRFFLFFYHLFVYRPIREVLFFIERVPLCQASVHHIY